MLRGHGSYVGSAAFSPDGKRVVTSSFDRTARVWDATAGRAALHTGNAAAYQVASAALSPTGSPDRRDVARRRSARPGRRPRSNASRLFAVGGARVVSAAFSADGRDVVTADAQAGVRFWDRGHGQASKAPGSSTATRSSRSRAPTTRTSSRSA